jgi:hypothetical protein
MAKMACAQCGGAKRMKAGGTSTEDPVSKKTIRQGMRAERKMDRQDKRWDRKYEKQKAEELMKSKRFKEGGMTGIIGMPKYGNNPRTQEGRMLKKGGSLPANTTGVKKTYAKGGVTGSFAPNRAVMASCKNGSVRDASGRCVMERKMALGGVAKKQNGGPKMVSWMKDGLSKSTGKRRIIDSKVPMTGPDAPMGKTPMARKGGATKATKFAALAPPYDKATAADRIAGAKKNKKK